MTSILFLIIVLIALIVVLAILIRDAIGSRKPLTKQEQRPDELAPVTEDVAEAAALVRAAQEKAEKIVRETQFFSRDVEADIKESLAKTSEEIVYEAREHMRDIANHMQAAAEQHMAHFAERLTTEATALEIDLQGLRKSEMTKITAEINDYKKGRIAELEASLTEILPAVVRDAAGRAIPLPEHEKLVREALERATQEQWPRPSL